MKPEKGKIQTRNHQEPFGSAAEKRSTWAREAKWFLSLLWSGSFRGRMTFWGTSSGSGWKMRGCRFADCGWEGRGKNCVIVAKHLETFQFHLFPNRNAKCWGSLTEKGKPQAVFFLYGGSAVALSQPFPSVFLWIFLPGANHRQQKVEESCLTGTKSQSKCWICSTGCVWYAYSDTLSPPSVVQYNFLRFRTKASFPAVLIVGRCKILPHRVWNEMQADQYQRPNFYPLLSTFTQSQKLQICLSTLFFGGVTSGLVAH